MKLFYFTYCYPYSTAEQWKANELKVLVKYFDDITVVPFFYGGNARSPKKMPAGVKLKGPLFTDLGVKASPKDYLRLVLHKKAYIFFYEFLRKKVFLKETHFRSWLGTTLNIMRLLKHPLIREIIREGDSDTILYFYWGKGSSEMLPFIDTKKFKKTFVRMHRFDLFEYVNDNYIPYRGLLLNKVDVVAPSSEAGKRHLTELYPEARARIEVFRCGTAGNNKLSNYSVDNVFRIASCSGLSGVKRVHLMIEALQYINFPVEWHHLGSGQLEGELKQLTNELHVEEKFIFEGHIDSEKVLDFYTDKNKAFDVFVNTSESEGVPFSIMEAFAVGIPVIATKVGGTGEIVDDEVGRIIDPHISPCQLAAVLKEFYELPEQKKIELRKNAFGRYMKDCNAEKLAAELGASLKS